eukprot:TRINITY_DN3573_c0_g2_i1.p1 TRINITY_DN3573_c0_g2~~TRINITY_DN3573_c0_g2_i1.p1  ORF type:complete len:327 (+),score=123.59 TRINITY_DN3573_c0_g2_i1:82-1062(+)
MALSRITTLFRYQPCAPLHHLVLEGSNTPVLSSTARFFSTRSLKPVIRDPERPVRPPSPWIGYLADFRKQQSGAFGAKELFLKASASWKALPESQKKSYVTPYEQAQARYKEQMKAYEESGKKAAWERDPARPKKPMTAYFRFAQEHRGKAGNVAVTEATKLAAQAWKGLSPAEKSKYEQAYTAEKAKYERDMEAYKASGKEEEYKRKVGIFALEEKAKAADEKKKAKELADKAKEKAKKEKVKAAAAAKKEKVKAKAAADKKKEKELAEKAKEKIKKEKAKLAAQASKERLKEKAQKLKEKVKAAAAKAKAKASASKAKAKASKA